MPSLTDLGAYFIRHGTALAGKGHGRPMWDGKIQWGGFPVETMEQVDFANAHGIMFLCPVCFKANGGPVRTHSVLTSFAGRDVPDDRGSHNKEGKPSRWNIVGGTGLSDLSLTPSIALTDGCMWHGYIGSNGVPPGHAA